MELESIYWARLRALGTRTTSLDGRISILEDRLTPSSPTSADRWERIKWLATIAFRVIGFLSRHWGGLTLIMAAAWTLALPLLRWLWRELSSGLAWLVGLGIG
jgi:hypothetical protein